MDSTSYNFGDTLWQHRLPNQMLIDLGNVVQNYTQTCADLVKTYPTLQVPRFPITSDDPGPANVTPATRALKRLFSNIYGEGLTLLGLLTILDRFPHLDEGDDLAHTLKHILKCLPIDGSHEADANPVQSSAALQVAANRRQQPSRACRQARRAGSAAEIPAQLPDSMTPPQTS